MDSEISLLCSQEPAACPCPEADKSIPFILILFLENQF